MCDENDEGLDRAAAIAFGNLQCEKSNSRYARAVLPPGRNGFECQVVDQEMLRLPGS